MLPASIVEPIGTSAFMVGTELALLGFSLVVIGRTTSAGCASSEGLDSGAPSPDNTDARRRAACLEIGTSNGLTDKETATLEYLSMGYTMQRIAELQYVSQNTVRSHVKSLYRKLSCHSKQEVIELVMREMKVNE